MTLTQLEYILALNEYRHFGRAATACRVTQPSLSMQIQKLEEELNLTIFDRSKNPIYPTLEGEEIIRQAQRVIVESKKIFAITQEKQKHLCGEFRLAVIPTLSPYLIPLFAKNFAQKHPEVRLIVEEYRTEDIVRYLVEDKIDAGLLATPLHNDQLIERTLYYEPFYLFISPDHQLAKKSKVHQDDLQLNEIWLLNKGNCFRDQVINICAPNKSDSERFKENLFFESGNFETLKNMVLKFSGYTIIPWMAVEQLPAPLKKNFVRPFVKPIPTREISLVHARIFLKERIITAIEEEIYAALPKELKALKNKEIDVIDFVNAN
ncbi:MAG: hydrogen peroxide-inducible genes activator [Oligoflexia bacterium]|nr:hydrogen peroxide-inducible genes activator [Oligoflexia bacterium]MBF0366387.1 hydrogen peroxide-inducible genes activator [Oligoflexia bacterium]